MYQRYVKVKGTARERGYQFGVQMKEQIITNYINQTEYYKNKEQFDYKKWEKMAERYVPMIEKWAPEVLEEMRGLAEGAEMEFDQILALTTAYEKSFARDQVSDKCTAFLAAPCATKDGKVIVGQTNDECFREWLYQLDVVVHHQEGKKEVLTYTHPGIPAYMGINNDGLCIMWTYIDNGVTGNGVPTNVIIRHLLELKTVDEAIKYLQEVPHDIPNQFSVADSSGKIACVECFPNRVYVKSDDVYLVHTNHNLFAEDEEEYTCSLTTVDRYEVMNKQVKENIGNIDVELAKEFFRSHERFPNSICSHPYPEKPWNKTVATMVFDLTEGEMHIAFGNACETPFNSYKFEHYYEK